MTSPQAASETEIALHHRQRRTAHVTITDQSLPPIALSRNAFTILHNLRELLMAEIFGGRLGEELAYDSAKQDVLALGIGTTMAFLINDGACWRDLMSAIEKTIHYRDNQDIDDVRYSVDELSAVFRANLPNEVAVFLFEEAQPCTGLRCRTGADEYRRQSSGV